MNGWAVCLVLQGETGSKGLHSRGRNTPHLRMATGHQQDEEDEDVKPGRIAEQERC